MTSLKKELRTLAWPAAAIVAVIVVPMVWASTFAPTNVPRHLLSEWMLFNVSSAGFFLGSALLAALPFGSEFLHRTMGLLMAQPVRRSSVWLTKHAALLGVLAIVGLAGYFATGALASRDGYPAAQAGLLLVLLCSRGFWTLAAGSTIGGGVFSLAGLAIVELTAGFVTSRVIGLQVEPFTPHPVLGVTRVLYAALTLWIGWRMFARYELKAQGEAGIAVAAPWASD